MLSMALSDETGLDVTGEILALSGEHLSQSYNFSIFISSHHNSALNLIEWTHPFSKTSHFLMSFQSMMNPLLLEGIK